MTTAVDLVCPTGTPMTPEQRASFEQDGFLVVPGALGPAEVEHHAAALRRLHTNTGVLHRLGAVSACPTMLPLVDHPRVFGLVWSVLGWNIHLYHSHLDVHPPVPADQPDRFVWHQDGGPQNRDLETDPRPRLSVKVAFWLSDLSEPDRGNLEVLPGSHLDNRLSRPPTPEVPWPRPDGAVPILAQPGDAILLDRRLWHARSTNRSTLTRRAAFFAYTYRWITAREHLTVDLPGLTPVQQQLLGTLPESDGDHAWAYQPEAVPLFRALGEVR